jgi:soluble lytic murein transglycosylase
MDVEESEELLDTCHAAPDQNIFCYSVLNREALEAKGRSIASKPSGVTRAGYTVHPRFRHHRVSNWLELRFASVGPLSRGVGSLRPSELSEIKRMALAEAHCPNNVAIAVAATLEEQLREGLAYDEIATLYRRGGDCLGSSPADRENLLTRSGLFYYAMKDYAMAAKVLARSAAIDTAFVARPLYWLYRSYQARHDEKRAKETLAKLQTRYPFSFHTLIALTAQNRDPGEILENPNPAHLKRSQQKPSVNFLIEQTEILHHFAFEASAAKTLDWAIQASQGAEPELMLYLAELKRERGDYHSKISILSDVLYKNPTLVSRETLELYFPKVFFPIFEKQSSVIDPYLLLAIARRESAFRIGAVSGANARGLLQLLPETGRRMASRPVNLLDPDTNVELGARYITDLLQKVRGQIHFALAAYNAGPNKLFVWTERYPTDDPVLFTDLIPYRETREYVASVLRNYYWYRRLHKSNRKMTPRQIMQLADSSMATK